MVWSYFKITLTQKMTNKERLLDLSYRYKLSHLGSCLTALPIIEYIYATKKPEDKFILSEGHSHLAHLVVREAAGEIQDAESALRLAGIHCDRKVGCDASTGSLGQGLPIAVGMALADKSKDVFCLVSDGELAEGSCWEALRIAKEQNLTNLKIYLNANGTGGLGEINTDYLETRIGAFGFPVEIRVTDPGLGNWARGVAAHYKVADEELLKQENML